MKFNDLFNNFPFSKRFIYRIIIIYTYTMTTINKETKETKQSKETKKIFILIDK